MEWPYQFVPYLCGHITKYDKAGERIQSYFSVAIYEEFTEFMRSKVLAAMVTEI
jgi:hypothetical protein